jgi:hypothetical protein
MRKFSENKALPRPKTSYVLLWQFRHLEITIQTKYVAPVLIGASVRFAESIKLAAMPSIQLLRAIDWQ